MKVAHVITNLATGGAEMMLLKLVQARSDGIRHSVISLRELGTIGPRIQSLGADVFPLGWSGGKIPGPGALKLVGLLDRLKPDVVQGWMYHGNLAATIGHIVVGRSSRLCWSIRCSYDSASHEKILTRSVIRLGRYLSDRPYRTIYNSTTSLVQHVAAGFSSRSTEVIPNGFDLKRFKSDPDRRAAIRRRLGIESEDFVVGHVARVHPMKDQGLLLNACASLTNKIPPLRVVAVGRDMDRLQSLLPEAQAPMHRLGSRALLLPEQSDIAELMPAFDVLVLSSAWGEGFPNVLGEAMASGVPCIATDVGDSREVVGNTGVIVPPGSVELLADAIARFFSKSASARAELGMRARRRVEENYAIENVVQKYEAVWRGETPRMELRAA